MKQAYKNLRECVFHAPSGLLSLPSKLKTIASNYLPFSTGIEIECSTKEGYEESSNYAFHSLRRIHTPHVTMNRYPYKYTYLPMIEKHDNDEKRFRLDVGIIGMMQLQCVTEFLKEYCELNPASGIHYHIDISEWMGSGFSESYDTENWLVSNCDWVINELLTWKYNGSYNRSRVGTGKTGWVRICREYRTIEFRIGEMTFDYDLIIKRITHCQSIVRRIRDRYVKYKRKKAGSHIERILSKTHVEVVPDTHITSYNIPVSSEEEHIPW